MRTSYPKSRRAPDGDAALYFNLPRQQTLDELDRVDSEESLATYCKLAWPILEPKRRFVHGWHIDAMTDHLQAMYMGHFNRLVINVPPGTMKSLTTNVFFPSWIWGPKQRPEQRFISWSYSQDLTIRDNRRTRMLMQSPWYNRIWGHQFKLLGDQNSKIRFDNDKTGFKIASSIGGLATGERGDYAIVDDPHNILEAESDAKRHEVQTWFLEVLPTRLNDPEHSNIIVIMQRLHDADVSGIIFEKELGYVSLVLPMEYDPEMHCTTIIGFSDPRSQENELIFPERFPREVVERDKRVLGEYATAGQFQQRPAPRGGGIFKRKWWNFYQGKGTERPKGCTDRPTFPCPEMEEYDLIMLTIDATFKKNVKELQKETAKGSRVGMLVLGFLGAMVYVIDDWTQMMSFHETIANVKRILGLDEEWKGKSYPDIICTLVELKANGQAIVDTLVTEVPGVIGVEPEGGKESRAHAITPRAKAGQILVPEGESWVPAFIDEFGLFGSTARNDRVDALSQGIIHLQEGIDIARTKALATFE
jgi:predicted phage terminase large subunit-like protein